MNNQVKKTIDFALSKLHFIVVPVILCTVLGAFAALFGTRYWSASQALFIRDDSIGSVARGGRFDSVDMMQVSQETILQIAQHPTVIEAALKQVGKEKGLKPSWFSLPGSSSSWPGEDAIEDLGDRVSIKSPKGTQFGRTEVIYVMVKDKSPERAGKLAHAVSEQLGKRMMKLREDRYASVANEIEASVSLAKNELATASKKLKMVEKQIGSDLVELRSLLNGGTSEGNVRRVVTQLEGELRGAKAAYAELYAQVDQLTAAAKNPDLMLSIPNNLLDNQPALRRLKEGLSEAQIRTAQLAGSRSAQHPEVVSSRKAEASVKQQLHTSLISTVGGLRTELVAAGNRVNGIQRQLKITNGRMGGIASLRTEYDNLNSEVSQRVEFLKNASNQLSMARSNEMSAKSVSLIQLVDQPVVGNKPGGTGIIPKMLIGAIAGLMIGGSLIFLMLPVAHREGASQGKRRASDAVATEEEAKPRSSFSRFVPSVMQTVRSGLDRRGSNYSDRGRRLIDHPGVQNIAAGRRQADTN